MSRTREQKLIDIAFGAVLTVLDDECHEVFRAMDQEERTAWVRDQLADCGFHTQPLGCSHGVLVPTPVTERRGIRIDEPRRLN